jgi:hypothetical protein
MESLRFFRANLKKRLYSINRKKKYLLLGLGQFRPAPTTVGRIAEAPESRGAQNHRVAPSREARFKFRWAPPTDACRHCKPP